MYHFMKAIKTGILSYGFSGRIFQSTFIHSNDKFELTAITQRHGNSAKEDYPYITLYRDYDDMLQNDEIELIIISTPAHLHFEHALKAIKAGKHVLVEKPFSATLKEAKTLIDTAKEYNVLVTAYQNRRFDGDFLTIKKLIDDGIKIFEYEATWDRGEFDIDPSDWHEQGFKGSDLLYDLGPHLLDQALNLFGLPISYQGLSKKLRPGSKIIDYFTLTLNYEDKVVRLKSCMHASKEDVRYKLHTNKGTYYFYNMDLQEEQLLSGIRPLHKEYGDTSNYDLFKLDGTKTSHQVIKGNYTYFFDKLADAVRNNGELPVPSEDILKVIEILESIS